MKKIRDVLLLTCVAILYLKSADGMWAGGSSGTAYIPAPGKVRVTFNDNDFVEDAITPVPSGPEWLKPEADSRPAAPYFFKGYARPFFETYEIYTITRVDNTQPYTNKYSLHVDGPKFSKNRIPIKGELDVNVGQSIQTFKTYFFKVYNAFEFLLPPDFSLPRAGKYGRGVVTGFIYIAMKKTQKVYIGELYLQKRDTINAFPGSEFSRASIWPVHGKPRGNVQVEFKDHIHITDLLEPTDERPKWMESKYGRSKFKSYSMYTMIHAQGTTLATYYSDTTRREGERVSNIENHIPIKARLDVNVGLMTETFKTDQFEPYDPRKLSTLPFFAAYGEVIGYIIITIKGSKFIYMGNLYDHKSNLNNVPVRSGLGIAHMMADEYEPPLRKVRVDFRDKASFEALLKPNMYGGRPEWMEPEGYHNHRSPFQKYFMFTVIQVEGGLATYLSESYGPENVLSVTDIRKHYVTDLQNHLPVKAKLALNVGHKTEMFKSYVLEPYNPFHDYLTILAHGLTVQEKYGEVFGYIFMTIRGTTDIYVGPLHVYRSV